MSRLTFKETFSSSDDSSSDSSNDSSNEKSSEYSGDETDIQPNVINIAENVVNRPSKRPRIEKTLSECKERGSSKKGIQSTFLSNFLAKKKIYSIPEPPIFPPMNDDILREFSIYSKMRQSIHSENKDRKMSITSVDSIAYDTDSSSDIARDTEVADRSSNLTLQLFNLPYTMTEDQVESENLAIIDKHSF